MGYYAVEREIRETGRRIMREEMRKAELHAASPKTLELSALIDFAAAHDMKVTTPSQHHVQVRDAEGKVFSEWWPNKGTTMMGGKRGPKCRTAADVVAWLREA